MEPLKEILSKKTILVSLLLILSFGSFLRFYGLSNQSLWNDELSSWSRSNYENLTEVIKKGCYPRCPSARFPYSFIFCGKIYRRYRINPKISFGYRRIIITICNIPCWIQFIHIQGRNHLICPFGLFGVCYLL